jgi:nucleotide-binding universal stress UspA family protein
MVPVLRKILFATDLTENSKYAFYFAASIASYCDGKITILHVMEKNPINIEHSLSSLLGEEKWQELKNNQERKVKNILIGKKKDDEMIRKALAMFCGSAGTISDLCSFSTDEILIKSGKVVEEIVGTAKEKGCDLIVVGSHKRFLGSASVGSVTKGLLQKAGVPVLVAPPPLSETP